MIALLSVTIVVMLGLIGVGILAIRKMEALMSASTDLTTAVANLTTVAEAAVAKLGTPAGDDPAVVAAVTAINGVAASLSAATNPPAQ